jgi:hypothetical protein
MELMRIVLRDIIRELAVLSLSFLPSSRNIAIERWLRGRDEYRMLLHADCVIVSFPNSGDAWLQVLLSRFYQVREGLAGEPLRDLETLCRKNQNLPCLFFTHDNYVRDYTKLGVSKAAYRDRRVILLVRDPLDVAVSRYSQWKYRMHRRKKRINHYPRDAGMSLFEFVTSSDGGLPRIIRFMNEWAQELPAMHEILVVRYEDLRIETENGLGKILDFIGILGTEEHVRDAVEFSSVARMRRRKEQRSLMTRGDHVLAKKRSDLDSQKVRRAKIGGNRSVFTTEQISKIDRMIDNELSPIFGYGRLRCESTIFQASRSEARMS